MSHAFYGTAGLRFWTQNEIRLRERIKGAIVDAVQTSLLGLNQMWRFEEVDTPVLMPLATFHEEYRKSPDELFLLSRPLAGEDFALRGETTNGSYAVARHLLASGEGYRAPLCVFTLGQSFRREESDGATAAKLRFYSFYQLEFQCIYSEGTKAPIAETVREALVPVVQKIIGLPTRLITSDRLPAYSRETTDIEVMVKEGLSYGPFGAHGYPDEWREVASTSIRTDFPEIVAHKPYEVFEIAFGMDRLVALAQGHL